MKLGFSKHIDYVSKDGGNFTLSVLTMEDLLLVMDKMAEFGKQDLDPEKLDRSQIKSLTEAAAVMVPKYIVKHDVQWPDGTPVTVAELGTDARLTPLLTELFMQLVQISSPSDTDRKNSNAPSA